MGRAEALCDEVTTYRKLFMDGIGNGLDMGVILILVGFLRELFGSGKLFGITVMESIQNGGWYQPNGLFPISAKCFYYWLANLGITYIKTRTG